MVGLFMFMLLCAHKLTMAYGELVINVFVGVSNDKVEHFLCLESVNSAHTLYNQPHFESRGEIGHIC